MRYLWESYAKKHPRYTGKNKPTTKFTEAEGCTCHTAYQAIVDACSTKVIVEQHGGVFNDYNGELHKTWSQSVDALELSEIAKKLFKQNQPGLSQVLKVYADKETGREFMFALCAKCSVTQTPTRTHVKVSSRDCFVTRKNLSPLDIHKLR